MASRRRQLGRAERVQELRSAILNGTYETDDKLSTALDRLLDEIA